MVTTRTIRNNHELELWLKQQYFNGYLRIDEIDEKRRSYRNQIEYRGHISVSEYVSNNNYIDDYKYYNKNPLTIHQIEPITNLQFISEDKKQDNNLLLLLK